MSFNFKKASCVVVGSFNINIIQPKWLAKHEIIDKEVEVGILFNLEQPGFQYHIPTHQVIWNVAPDKITIESENPEVNPGIFISSVLSKLPETPLFAIGNNLIYEAEKEEIRLLAQPIRDFINAASPLQSETVQQQSFHFTLKQREHEILNLQLSIKEEKIILMCNVHTELRERSDASDAAVLAAKHYFEDRISIKPLVHHYFGMTI